MNISELRKKLLRQSSTVQRLCTEKRKVSYQSVTLGWSKNMNDKVDTLPFIDTVSYDADSIYHRFFLTTNEKKLLEDIYLSDFDELIDFDE